MKKTIIILASLLCVAVAVVFMVDKHNKIKLLTDSKDLYISMQNTTYMSPVFLELCSNLIGTQDKLNKLRNAEGNKSLSDKLLIGCFFLSVKTGKVDSAKYYLEQDPKLINTEDKEHNNTRAMSILVSNLDTNVTINKQMFDLLLEYHPELNYPIPDAKNASPIHFIAAYSSSEILNLLINNGADVNFRADNNISALQLSYEVDNFDTFKTLLRRGASIDEDNGEIFGDIFMSYMDNFQGQLNSYTPVIPEVLAIIESKTFKAIHTKNMRYLKEILSVVSKENIDTYKLSGLATLFAATNQVDGIELLIQHNICKLTIRDKTVCDKAIETAQLNDNQEIIKLLNTL